MKAEPHNRSVVHLQTHFLLRTIAYKFERAKSTGMSREQRSKGGVHDQSQEPSVRTRISSICGRGELVSGEDAGVRAG